MGCIKRLYISQPSSESNWKNIVSCFENHWHMAHCLGAIDGKHTAVKKPAHSGSFWLNFKGYSSMFLSKDQTTFSHLQPRF